MHVPGHSTKHADQGGLAGATRGVSQQHVDTPPLPQVQSTLVSYRGNKGVRLTPVQHRRRTYTLGLCSAAVDDATPSTGIDVRVAQLTL